MRISVRYFASLREALGAGEVLELPPGSSVAQARSLLAARDDAHAAALAPGRPLRSALDQALCDAEAVVGEGAELAFFPPVTGG